MPPVSHPIRESRPFATDFPEHGLDRDCWDRPVHEYACFNDFFSRGLAVGARPIAEPHDDGVVVSAADCRLMVSTLSAKTHLECLALRLSSTASTLIAVTIPLHPDLSEVP